MSALSTIDEVRGTFATHRYAKLEGFLDDKLRQMLYDHIQRQSVAASASSFEGQVGALELSADPLMEFLLAGIHPRIEELSGCKLYPTYSFCRTYHRGHFLVRHRDRPSCEVSVSLNLGPKLNAPWPLWVKGPLGESAVAMEPGDAVLYRGIECEHWREPFEEEQLTQVFLHYVEQDGPHRDLKFDKRSNLGIAAHPKP
jgi:hypothetical protein